MFKLGKMNSKSIVNGILVCGLIYIALALLTILSQFILADLGEIATRELVKEHKPYGLKENREMAKRGGRIAKSTRDNLEKELGKSVISKQNALNYKYIDNKKLIEDKKTKIKKKK